MFGTLFDLATDVVKVVTAPIEIALDTTRVVTKPMGDLAQEAVSEIKQATKSVTE